MVSVNFGIYTATVTVPANALPITASVTITLYGTGHGPHTLQSAARSPKSLGANATELAEVAINTGGVAPVLPLKLSLTGVSLTSGTVIMLAGYGTPNAFTDVDTVTLLSNVASEDDNILYPGASLAANTVYGFYEIAHANVPAPSPTITAITPASVPAATTTQLSATETNGNGFPYLIHSFTFSTTDSALGTLTTSGSLSAGALDETGPVLVTDTTSGRGSPSNTVQLAISSARPGASGDSFTFTGTISSTQQLTASPTTAPQVTSGTVTVTTNVTADTAVSASNDQAQSTSTEVDKYALQTITTTTNTVNQFALTSPFNVSVVSTDAVDSNGAEYVNTYGAGNGLLDVLPETAGSFGPNTAALVYQENDPANYTRTRTINANGSYTEDGYDPFGDEQIVTTNSDLSASYDASQYDYRTFSFTKPTGSPAMITIGYEYNDGNPNDTQTASFPIMSWIPTGTTQPSVETDVDDGATPFPSGCAVPAKYGTNGNKIVQSITRVDPALGNYETEVITTYVVPIFGPACIVMTDNVNTYYDYTAQYGYGLYYSAAGFSRPVETTNTTETLTLSSSTTSVGTLATKRQASSSSRATASIGAGAPAAPFIPLAFARSRFERTVHEKLGNRNITFKRDFFAAGAHAK